MITRQAIIDIFNAIKTAVEGAIPAGTNAIGSVDVDNFPATQTVDGTVGVDSLPALPTGTNKIGDVGIDGTVGVDNFPPTQTVDGTVGVNNYPTKQQVNFSQAGTDNQVDVGSFPSLPAGTNAIGSVDVDNFPTSVEVENPTGASLNVQVTGSTVVIDGITYQLTDGAVLRGTDAIKPTAPLAHAEIPYCYYFAIDTGVVEATDGTNWVVI